MTSALPPLSREQAEAEYKLVTENLRHIAGRRDRRIALYLTVAGFLIFVLFRPEVSIAERAVPLVTLVGAFVTLTFVFIELRLWAYWMTNLNRAKQLEECHLGFHQFRRPPGQLHFWPSFWATISGRLEGVPLSFFLYLGFLVIWLSLFLIAKR